MRAEAVHSHDRETLDGRVAIVTGASVGIGRSVCVALAGRGASVVVVGRNEQRVADTVAELDRIGRGRTFGCPGDVRSEGDMLAMARATLERFGRIDILVASAGILRARNTKLKMLVRMTPAEWDEVVDTNLKGVFLANQAVLPAMIEQSGGHIINLSSTSGRKAYAFDTAYCASKFGVIGLTEAIADEVRQYGVRVDVLLPGAIDTPMWEQNGPFRRPDHALSPERVADVVLSMLLLPQDTMLVGTTVEPFCRPPAEGWKTEAGTAKVASSRAAAHGLSKGNTG